ncbi:MULTISPECIES: MerR family transcriptional regulator [Modicisalibacter]|uniref:MerR family transcriptional regulator n=1 Tax=Modicisalibacter TaxID=574347 RepID=UPI00100AC60B|nr:MULTISPECIES: MerR family transcriptional regulator [Halomonadaceae]MBZ9558904.1 MerR family transcriptional regulator [Modicisalibacter sp. R2A 31.J]MBZ9575204.1 MerR family transcriptional regulator [Modicisalibacter sp. MOD 31.J]
MTDKPMDPSGAPLYPIREVSRLTGVNSVTLRAWERRYGLIRPQRTPKGHRLYARNDIQRVERILQWLNRGVPVSQVRDLLEQPEAPEAPIDDSGDWAAQRRQLMASIEALDLVRLEALYNQSLALYPVATCLAELWEPAIGELEEHWSDQLGATLQRRTLESFLRTRIGTRLYHANLASAGPVLLVSRLPDDPGALWSLLFALLAADAGFRVQLFDTPLPLGEWPLAVERLKAGALVLVSGQAERNELIRRQLPRLAEQLSVPVCLVGPVTRIRASEVESSALEALGELPTVAIERLRPLVT